MQEIRACTLFMQTQDGYVFRIINFYESGIKDYLKKMILKKKEKSDRYIDDSEEKMFKDYLIDDYTTTNPDILDVMRFYGVSKFEYSMEFLNGSVVYLIRSNNAPVLMIQQRKISGEYYMLSLSHSSNTYVGNSQYKEHLQEYKDSKFYDVMDIRTNRTKKERGGVYNPLVWLHYKAALNPEKVSKVSLIGKVVKRVGNDSIYLEEYKEVQATIDDDKNFNRYCIDFFSRCYGGRDKKLINDTKIKITSVMEVTKSNFIILDYKILDEE